MTSPSSRIWAFDFDGTISHLVPERDEAALDTECRSLISELANDPGQVVAVISSRSLDDLIGRIDIANVIVSGSSGLEWLIPGSHRLGPDARAVDRLERERKRLVPALGRLARIPGVEIEDKTWSTAVHFRGAAAEDRILVARELENLHIHHGVSWHYGPEVAEVQFLQEVSKEIAVKTLMTLVGSGLTGRSLVYAGDDQNDAQAMRWVLGKKGLVYIVGNRISVDGATVVSDPTALALAIRRRFEWIGAGSSRQDKGVVNE